MTDTVQQIALSRALKTLDAIGAQYAVTFDGETHGTLELAPPPRKRKDGRPQYPRGLTHAYYWPYVEPMQAGDVVKIPFGGFDSTVLASNISAACTHAWGSGTYVTKRDEAAQTISLLRIA